MPKKKTIRKNSYEDRDNAAGIGSREIYIDKKTFRLLLRLLEKSGYDIDNKFEKKQGISGVLLHLVTHAAKKSNIEKLAGKKKQQQKALLARTAHTLLISGDDRYSYKDVVTMWKRYPIGRKILNGKSSHEQEKKAIDKFISKQLKRIPSYG